MVGFLSNFHGYKNIRFGHNKCFGDLYLIFKVTAVEKLKIHGGVRGLVGRGEGALTSVFFENTVTSSYCFRLDHRPWGQCHALIEKF